MHNRYPNRRWIFLTSGDAATGVDFNQVMETSPATCRYNVAPTPGTETFVKYNVIEYPQHSGEEPQIPVYSGWYQSGVNQPTWQGVEMYPETAVQSSTDDTYKYEYEVTGSGAYLEWDKPTGITGGGWIEQINIIHGGSGYSSDGNLTATGGGGSGFAGTFTIGTFPAPITNMIETVTITSSGEGYTSTPSIVITPTGGSEGSGGLIEPYVSPGQPIEPSVTGTGYYPLYTDNILGSGFFAASGQTTGQPHCFDLALEVEASGGNVTSLDITSGGSGYGPSGTLTAVGGGGSGFSGTFLAAASGGWVEALNIVSGGSGYDGNGALAAVGGVGSGFSGTYGQTSGVIDSVMLLGGGENYVSAPEITIVPPSGVTGSGAFVSSSIQVSGAINSVTVVDAGRGYYSVPSIVIGTDGVDGEVTAQTNSWSASGREFTHEETLNILSTSNWTNPDPFL